MADDLIVMRDRLVEALTREHYRRADERIAASVEEHCTAFADAVMVVVGPDLSERDALKAARCPSCDHLPTGHQEDGCWYAVTTGTPGRDLVCPCTLPGTALDGQARTTTDNRRDAVSAVIKPTIICRDDAITRADREAALPGMWEVADLIGGSTDAEEAAALDHPTGNPTACQGCADTLAACLAGGGQCCDLCQHPRGGGR